VILLLFVVSLFSCGGGGGTTAILTAVTVTPNDLTIASRTSRQFTATGTFSKRYAQKLLMDSMKAYPIESQ